MQGRRLVHKKIYWQVDSMQFINILFRRVALNLAISLILALIFTVKSTL